MSARFDRRRYAREYARRQRWEAWARVAMKRTRCPAMLANGKPCRWPLENRVINGHTVPFCAQCDRKARGICLDCRRAPVAGVVRKALRCAGCAKVARVAHLVRYKQRHPARVRRIWQRVKQRLAANPSLRQARLDYKRLWRAASPALVKRYREQWNKSARAREYRRAYQERYRERQRERDARRARGEALTHPCLGCGVALTGRAKKCETCRTMAYERARAALTGRAA